MIDYYKILGINKSASQEDIKKAYRSLAHKHHPDKNIGDKKSEDLFKKINEAYEVLSDENKKQIYDRGGDPTNQRQASSQHFTSAHGFGDINDIFARMQQDFMFNTSFNAQKEEAAKTIRIQINVSFEDAFTGKDLEVKYKRRVLCEECHGHGSKNPNDKKICPTCNGTGSVRSQVSFMFMSSLCPECKGQKYILKDACYKCGGNGFLEKEEKIKIEIPKGVDTGYVFKKDDYGHQGKDGKFGAFWVYMDVEQGNEILTRDRSRITMVMKVPFHVFFTEEEIEIPTFHGPQKIKAKRSHMCSGTKKPQVRLEGKGFPVMGKDEYGDLFVIMIPETPEQIPEELVENLKKIKITKDSYPEYSKTVEHFKNKGTNK